VLAHYGVVALPCRVGDPDRKGKVEAGVGHAKKTPLRGLRFESLDEAQAYLDRMGTLTSAALGLMATVLGLVHAASFQILPAPAAIRVNETLTTV
jgi:hypothetical protein